GFAGSIINDAGDSSYEARRALVNKGDFKTYFYGNFGTAAFVCEVSDTTIQDTALVDGICRRNLAGIYYLLRRSGYARLTGAVTDSITGTPLEAEVIVQQATSVDINPRLTRANSGRYNRLIDPGTYTLIVQKTGYVTKTITGVVVNNSGPTTTNVRLRPTSSPPGTPVLLSPANNSIFNDSLALNFDWNNSSGATGYVIEIANDENFTSYFQVDSSLTASNYRNSTSFHTGTFYWRVTARNGSIFSGRSSVWQFTIQIAPPLPSTPTLLAPANGSNFNDSLAFNFDWSNSTNATGYVFEIAYNESFTTLFEIDSSLTVSNHRNSAPFNAGSYYWRVTAFNTSGFSSRSSVWQFTIQMPVPDAPTLTEPANGLVSTSAYLSFDWNDPATATRYTIQIDTDSLFSPSIISDTTLLASQYTNSDSLANGRYFWHAKAANAHGWSGYSIIRYFDVNVQTHNVYTVGDVNGSNTFTGLDVTYSVRYFKGGPQPPYSLDCPPHGIWFVSGDVNGSCSFTGLDVTYMVRYFKGGVAPIPCPDCPPTSILIHRWTGSPFNPR
ncbi:MAG TPA: hypothetical protein DCZ43_08015, partial [candidate division Zixibacteria bacterium]|nr:hypothetical protein [candidate division Zixibacteria bacterium]